MSQITLQSQRSAPGKTIEVDGVSYVSLGQVGWPVGDGKFCVVDLVMAGSNLSQIVELRDVKAVVRVASPEAQKSAAAEPAKTPNRSARRKVAKSKRNH